MRRRGAADQDGRHRQAELVEQVVFDQLAQQQRTALGEHAEQPAFGEDLQHGGAVDGIGSRPGRVQHLGHRAQPQPGVVDGIGARQDQRRQPRCG